MLPKQTHHRSRKHVTIYRVLVLIGVVVSIWTAQGIATWLPWHWALDFAANASVWPILQAGCIIVLVLVAAGLFYIYRRRTAYVFAGFAVVLTVPVIQMFVTLYGYAEQHDIRLEEVRQFDVSRESRAPDAEVNFAQVNGHDMGLSLYLNPDRTMRSPVIVYVHGGGWSGGSRTENGDFFAWLNAHGYSVVSVDYRVANEAYASWRDAPRDVVCSLSWVAAHSHDQQYDLTRVTLMGDSAGGQIALRAAYGLANGDTTSSCGGTPATPRAVVGIVPAIDMHELYDDPIRGPSSRQNIVRYLGGSPLQAPDAYADASILGHVTPRVPPTLIINADRDVLVSPRSGEALAERLRDVGVRAEHYTVPYAVHSYWINPGGYQDQIARALIHTFLEDTP